MRVFTQQEQQPIPEMFLCVPEDYYSTQMQRFIEKSRADPKNRWIYSVIHDQPPATEIVLLRTVDWTLCRDKNSADGKWLVVLHDLALHSLRDLRSLHVPILQAMRKTVTETLQVHYNRPLVDIDFFVHYMPSTFQLHVHAHVCDVLYRNVQCDAEDCVVAPHKRHSRRHALCHIMRNLRIDGRYYTKCILMANMCKTAKAASIYTSMSSLTADKFLFK